MTIIQVRAANQKETTGTRGKEGYQFTAALQQTLDWGTLTEDDREALSDFLEAERKHYQERADPDPAKWAMDFCTLESRTRDDDFMVNRMAKTIKSAEHRELFMTRVFVSHRWPSLARNRVKRLKGLAAW